MPCWLQSPFIFHKVSFVSEWWSDGSMLKLRFRYNTECHISVFSDSDTAPVYLSEFLNVYSPSRQLHFSSDLKSSNSTCWDQNNWALPPPLPPTPPAPTIWNCQPPQMRHIQSTTAFKTNLVSHLFKTYYCYLKLSNSSVLFCKLFTWLL